MADPRRPQAAEVSAARRFLTFRMDERTYALPAEQVSEVIRAPAVARVPKGPRSLLGVANLRGSVLPIASLRGLLGCEEAGVSPRAIVLDGAAPVALAVDDVEALITVANDQVDSERAALSAHPGEQLSGAFRGADETVVKVLDIRAMLANAFTQRARPRRERAGASNATAAVETIEYERLVSFEVAGQEFALALDAVREIIPAPTTLALPPHAESLLLGIAAYRDGLLPILSLRGLLGFAFDQTGLPGEGQEKVLVTQVGGALVGLLADRMRTVIAIDPALIEPPPAVIVARMGGEARVRAIYRGEGGRRLISILATDKLFRDDVMRKLIDTRDVTSGADTSTRTMRESQDLFLVFRLGDDEFGLPIDAVDEVARVPDHITRVPKTPKFLEGVVNLRGEVLPVVDQRRRFDMPELVDGRRRRMVVVRSERHRAGLIVDAVSEVLRAERGSVEQAPDLAGEAVRLVEGVINLAGRIILLLDPAELLSRTERGLLDTFDAATDL